MSDVAEGPGFATLAIHAGVATLDPSSDIFAPVDQGTALLGFDGYGDGASQTVASANASLEERMATLEGGTAALAVASGRAAQFLALHILLQQGDELIAGGRPYGGALHQIGEAYQASAGR